MKNLSDKQLLETLQKKHALEESAAIEEAAQKEKERLDANESKLKFFKNSKETKAMKRAKVRKNVKKELTEAALNTIFDACFGNTDFDNTDEDDAFDSSIITNFIDDEGVDELLDRFSESTELLSSLALAIREAVDEAMDDYDAAQDDEDQSQGADDSDSSYVLDPSLKQDIIDNIQGDEDIEDITDVIRFKVSRAVEDFVQKNIVDKLNIKDIMYDTKEKIDAIKNGDDALDSEIAQEATMAAKRSIKEISKRPHSIFEQMIINMTEKILSNDQLKEAFTLEDGKINMDKIVKRCTSYYTFLEMVSTAKMKNVTDEYIKEALEMN